MKATNANWGELPVARGVTGPRQRWRCDPQSGRDLGVLTKALRGDGLRESRALNQKWVRSGRDAEPDLGAMQVLPPMVGHLDDGVCCFQDWISIRPGFVCDVMLVRMLYFGRCTAKGEFASQSSRSSVLRTKSSGDRLHSEA